MHPHPSHRSALPGAAIADAVLELSVAGSFSRLGYAARRRAYRWQEPPADALRGRTVLITGPTSGLGRAATDRLAALGARILLVGRSAERLEAVRGELVARHGEARFTPVVADMASLASVRAAARHIRETESAIDVLVDNAGAMFPTWTESPDGIESTFATMVVGPFVLTGELLPLLRRAPGARVVAVTSGGQYVQRLRLDDLESTGDRYSGPRAYARAKRAQVAVVHEWARRMGPDGIRFNAMHPGWADTPGLAVALPTFHAFMGPALRTPAEGIDTLVWLAAQPDAGTSGGRLYLDRRPRRVDWVPQTRLSGADRRRLWNEVVALTGARDPAPETAIRTERTNR